MWSNIIVPIGQNDDDYEHTVDTSTSDTLITYRVPGRFATYIFNEDVVKFKYSDSTIEYLCELHISRNLDPESEYGYVAKRKEILVLSGTCTETEFQLKNVSDADCFQILIWLWLTDTWKVPCKFFDIVQIIQVDLINAPAIRFMR
jgi:hypothetical protein